MTSPLPLLIARAASNCVKAIALATTLLAGPTLGAEPVATLWPDDNPPLNTGFGRSVGISGDYVAVGAPWDPWYNGDNNGAVYVFRRDGHQWPQQAKLTASQPRFLAQLGYSVAIDKDVVVAGAPAWEFTGCDLRNQGEVYVFRRTDGGTPGDYADDEWVEEARLTAPSQEHGIGFGFSISISGNVLVVGSDCSLTVEVFRYSGFAWLHEATLSTPDPQLFQVFGSAVAIDDHSIIVGAPGYAGHFGAVYDFSYDGYTWVSGDGLVPAESKGLGFFGQAVAIDGDRSIIGSPSGPEGGRSYLFIRQSATWLQESYVTATNVPKENELGNLFGSVVALNENLAVAGRRGRPWAYLIHDVGTGSSVGIKLSGDSDTSPLSTAMSGRFAVVGGFVYAVREVTDVYRFASLQNCFRQNDNNCESSDGTNDGKVTIEDFSEFLSTFSGP